MKHFAIIAGLVGMALSAQAQYGIAPGSIASEQAEPSPTQPYLHVLPAEEDTFGTYIYTFGDIVIFSYGDSARAEITDQSGNVIWSGNLNADEYAYRRTGEGIYQVRCNKEFSVLIGDPLSQIVQGWHAVDQHSRPLSNKFLTVMQGSWVSGAHAGRERFCVFAYHDNTDVTVKNLDDGTIIWTGTLDSLQRWEKRRSVQVGLPVSVEATKEVSVLSYGDCGYYAPAFNGTFTGRDFITFCGDLGGTNMIPWAQALKVVPWEDNTNVVVTDLDNPADTLWKFFVAKKGNIQSKTFVGRFLKVHADRDISCAMIPGTAVCYYHLVRAIDRNGLGIGTEFYIPALGPCSDSRVDGKIDLFAFYDDTEVRIFKMPDEIHPVWSGTLDKGGHQRLMTDWATYKVEATRGVAVIETAGDRAGADFLPLWFAIHPDVAAYPDQFRETECMVSTSQTGAGAYEVDVENNGNIWDVINIFTENSLDPDFVTELSDELGRPLPDVDGDGNPDTDTLPRRGKILVLADVTPGEMLPFGTTDTCFFSIVSMRDPTKLDTAFLVTRILEVKIMTDPDTFVTEYPRNTKVIPVA
ncbi:MAG: hypothetical protein U9Q76_10200, partial [candidate division WOR-3 bacterium]|nr:hypothetical protein [candidate division WOR-3 bacterium]